MPDFLFPWRRLLAQVLALHEPPDAPCVPAAAHKFCLDLLETKVSLCESPVEKIFCEAFEGQYSWYLWDSLVAQHRVGRYRLDFAYPEAMVGVEIDGREFHSTPEQKAADKVRQDRLESGGWKILRFTGSEVYRDAPECAIQFIRVICEQLGMDSTDVYVR
jgi:REase_MTES_1575